MYNETDIVYCDVISEVLDQYEINTRNSIAKRAIAVKHYLPTTPLVCVRKTAWKSAIREWEWFMSGSSNIKDLHESVHHWWKPWADKDGEVRNNYSKQFCRYNERTECFYDYEADDREGEYTHSFDQMKAFVNGVKKHPYSRRNLLTTWHAEEMYSKDTPITNCHNTITQAFVNNNGRLDLVTYQRSCDLICGVPHNWIQLYAFHMWLAHNTGWSVGNIIWIGGDVHIYQEHYALAEKILTTDPVAVAPVMVYSPTSKTFKADDFRLEGDYKPLLSDKAEMIV